MMELAESRTLHVGFPEKNEPFVDWDVTVQLAGAVPSEWSPVWSGCVRVPVQLVASVDEVIPLVRVPRLDNVVREGIAVSSHTTDAGRTYRVSLGATDEDFTTGISVRIEARRGEVLIESVLVPLRLDVEPQRGVTNMAQAELSNIPAGMTPNVANQEHWTLHVTGTNEGLLDSWEVERAWGGEFTMPLSEAMTRYELPK